MYKRRYKNNEDDDDTVIESVPDNEVETEVNATEASGVFPNVDHELPSITSEEENTVNDGEENENIGKHNVNDGTRRSNLPHALVKEYEPSFHGNRYEEQHLIMTDEDLRRIAINVVFTQMK